jgi:hypothetical protein
MECAWMDWCQNNPWYVLTYHEHMITHGLSFWRPRLFPGFGPFGYRYSFLVRPSQTFYGVALSKLSLIPTLTGRLFFAASWWRDLRDCFKYWTPQRETNLKPSTTVCYRISSDYRKYNRDLMQFATLGRLPFVYVHSYVLESLWPVLCSQASPWASSWSGSPGIESSTPTHSDKLGTFALKNKCVRPYSRSCHTSETRKAHRSIGLLKW